MIEKEEKEELPSIKLSINVQKSKKEIPHYNEIVHRKNGLM